MYVHQNEIYRNDCYKICYQECENVIFGGVIERVVTAFHIYSPFSEQIIKLCKKRLHRHIREKI